jgi:predicted lipid-binding transport protein (Tim44 family)
MKSLFVAALALFIGLSLPIGEAEAKRFGGGSSFGMKRSVTPPAKPSPSQSQAASRPNASAAAANTAAQAGKRSWLGPLAGIAGAIGLAALFSSLGLGEEMADFLMILLLVVGAFVLIRWLMGRSQKTSPNMSYAAAGTGMPPQAPTSAPSQAQPSALREPLRFRGEDNAAMGADSPTESAYRPEPQLPADFDAADFIRHAKRNFIRLQAANDAGDLEDIRDFTTPEMYAEIKLQFSERGAIDQRTDVVELNAEILDYAEEDNREILSVRFSGSIREDDQAAEPFDEAWHLTRPLDRSRHWAIAGIQQLG